MRSSHVFLIAAGTIGLCAFAGLDGSTVLPLEHEAIRYARPDTDDPVAKLQKKLAAGETRLEYDQAFGYLPSVLKQLGVRESSQVLVFSKTSFQAPRISPRMPRALYFNDQVSVGFVRGGDVVEFAATDPKQGIIFYTLDQERTSKPRFERQDSCLQCHASGATLGVPGLVVRSVFPDRNGMPMFQAGSFITDHRSPLKQRWGGWYVTGKHGNQQHLGNTIFTDPDSAEHFSGTEGLNVTDLNSRIDTGAYLQPHSDIVALMVLEHQTRMVNLITRVGWETRMALHDQEAMNKALGEPASTRSESTTRRINNAVEELVKYMLFLDEEPLTSEISGTSNFAAEYSAQGPLYQLDLKHRLYKYRCSPLIYSPQFKSLPEEARTRALQRIKETLAAKDPGVIKILTDTGILPGAQVPSLG